MIDPYTSLWAFPILEIFILICSYTVYGFNAFLTVFSFKGWLFSVKTF